MRALAALLVGCTFACAPPLAFTVASTFTVGERQQIQAAANDWNSRTVPKKHITLDGGAWRLLEEAPGTGYNGHCNGHERWIKIAPNPDNASTFAVALHEFGHAIGLTHLCDLDGGCDPEHPLGIMDPGSASVTFTPADLAECRRVGACP